MSCIAPIEALMALDPGSIPSMDNPEFASYGESFIETLFNFYGKGAEDDYGGIKNYSPPLLTATMESLKLEYGGFKNYVKTQKSNAYAEVGKKVKILEARLLNASADKYKAKRDIKALEEEIEELKKKQESCLTTLDLLQDTVVESAFPNI